MCAFKNEYNNKTETKKITKFLGMMPFSTLLWRSNPVLETNSTLIPRDEEVVGPTIVKVYASQIDVKINNVRDNGHHQHGVIYYHNRSRVHTVDNYSDANNELHVAASLGNVARVEELVGVQKELIRSKDSVGNLALHVAVKKGHSEVAKYLIREFPKGSYDFNHRGRSPLYIAVEKGNNDLVEYMLGHLRGDSKVIHSLIKDYSLFVAITSKSLEMVKIILEHQPIKLLNSTNQEGNTPLSHAAYTGAADIVDYILEKFPNAVVKDKSYPIHRACQGGHVHVLQKFELRCPRKIFIKTDPSGLNVLHHAASAPGNQLKHVVDFLLSLRCRPMLVDKMDQTNRTPFELARCSQNDEVMELFDRYLH